MGPPSSPDLMESSQSLADTLQSLCANPPPSDPGVPSLCHGVSDPESKQLGLRPELGAIWKGQSILAPRTFLVSFRLGES